MDGFAYSIPLPDDMYEVTLIWAETDPSIAEGSGRSFNVFIEERKVFGSVNIYISTGRNLNVEYRKTFVVSVTDGFLSLVLETLRGSAFLSGIEIALR